MKDEFCFWVARHLPRRLVYWCAIRLMAHAAHQHPQTEVDTLSPAQCLKAWSDQ